jgi:tRNA (guanine26-N2/guanine27-N2)-dimethyltransferase
MHRETTQQLFGCPTCPECGAKMDYTGPLWIGPINNEVYIDQLLKENQTVTFKNNAKISKLLNTIKTEATAPITYYVLDRVCKKLGLPATSTQSFLTALQSGGYQAVQTHFNPRGVKTDASAKTMQKTLKGILTAQA